MSKKVNSRERLKTSIRTSVTVAVQWGDVTKEEAARILLDEVKRLSV